MQLYDRVTIHNSIYATLNNRIYLTIYNAIVFNNILTMHNSILSLNPDPYSSEVLSSLRLRSHVKYWSNLLYFSIIPEVRFEEARGGQVISMLSLEGRTLYYPKHHSY